MDLFFWWNLWRTEQDIKSPHSPICNWWDCYKRQENRFAIRRKTDTCYYLSSALKNLNSILRNNVPFLYTNECMADLFKDPPMATFKRPRNLKGMVVRAILENPLPNGGFKTCSDARCFLCKHSTNTDSFKSHITGRTYKIFGKASCRTVSFIYLISCKVCLGWLTVCYRHSSFYFFCDTIPQIWSPGPCSPLLRNILFEYGTR